MNESQYAELSVIGMKGCEEFAAQVDYYLRDWRRHGGDESFLVHADCPRFGTGEAKVVINDSMRNHGTVSDNVGYRVINLKLILTDLFYVHKRTDRIVWLHRSGGHHVRLQAEYANANKQKGKEQHNHYDGSKNNITNLFHTSLKTTY